AGGRDGRHDGSPSREARDAAPLRLDADRVALEVQRQVQPHLAPALPRLRLARTPRGRRPRRGPGRAVLGAAAHRPLHAARGARPRYRRLGMSDPIPTERLTVLGQPVRQPLAHVECFAAPSGCTRVRFSTDELASLCPVTRQPDLSSVVIDYEPGDWCVESKSLKLYLWSFRDRPVFAEALAVEIADEIMTAAHPSRVVVTLTQHPRGGSTVDANTMRLPAERPCTVRTASPSP